MRSFIENESIVVKLNLQEQSEFARTGTAIGDRVNPLNIDAKIDVYPYSIIDPEFADVKTMYGEFTVWEQRTFNTPIIAKLFGNYDISLYVTQEMADHGPFFIGGLAVAKSDIDASHIQRYGAEILDMVPRNGIELRFANSTDPN